ncbi:MAG: HD family hydrolase [Candidatus Thorarchaeota archaeon]
MLPEDIITSFFFAEGMKRVERTGWNIIGIQIPRKESIAEHSWGTVYLSWLLTIYLESTQNSSPNLSKILSMAMIHDLPESIISDIPKPALDLGGDVMKQGKLHAETEALKKIIPPSPAIQKNALMLADELKSGHTFESRIVRAADLLDMIFHAITLERSGMKADLLNPFFESASRMIKDLDLEIASSIFNLLNNEHKVNLSTK